MSASHSKGSAIAPFRSAAARSADACACRGRASGALVYLRTLQQNNAAAGPFTARHIRRKIMGDNASKCNGLIPLLARTASASSGCFEKKHSAFSTQPLRILGEGRKCKPKSPQAGSAQCTVHKGTADLICIDFAAMIAAQEENLGPSTPPRSAAPLGMTKLCQVISGEMVYFFKSCFVLDFEILTLIFQLACCQNGRAVI
jgi:hypothetical protein